MIQDLFLLRTGVELQRGDITLFELCHAELMILIVHIVAKSVSLSVEGSCLASTFEEAF